MPVYQVSYQHGRLTEDPKAKAAAAITDAQKQKLIKRIVASWTEITGQSAKQVIAGLTEIDSEIQMEYGLILPRPGDEPQWFADNAAALDGISGTGL
jgi:phenylpyruvate tautomerase PptA (4-oxalocrotonate tautomerase family)